MGFNSVFSLSPAVLAQNAVVPDNTLGEESSQINSLDETTDRIEGGAIRAENLFHSFQDFSIEEGLAVYFANPANVENIFSRVTGDRASNLFGTLGVEGNANLFFLNPNGIVFGPNARLDIAGSLTLSTATAFDFEDSSQFSSAQLRSPLTVSVPLGLQRGGSAGVGDIESSGVLIVGGDVVLVAEEIKLNEGRVRSSGDIRVVANNLEATQGAQLNASGSGNAGNVVIEVSETARFDGVDEDAKESGGAFSFVEAGGEGAGGNISISAQNLELTNGAQIGSGTFGKGDAGDIVLQIEETIRFDGRDDTFQFPSGAFSTIELGGEGAGGDIAITANNLELTNGAKLVSSSFGSGEAGDIAIDVAETVRFSSIGPQLDAEDISGSVGRIDDNIAENDMDTGGRGVRDEDLIGRSPRGEEASRVPVDRMPNDRMPVDNPSDHTDVDSADKADDPSFTVPIETGVFRSISDIISSFDSGAFSLISNTGESGGNIVVRARNLEVEGTARLDASTFRTGDAGNIILEVADTVRFDSKVSDPGDEFFASGGLFSSAGLRATGNGGDVTIAANNLELLNGAKLEAIGLGNSDAGNISIDARQQVLADFGEITTISEAGAGGSVAIAAETVRLINNSDITTFVPTGAGDGGSITMTADVVAAFNDSDILSFATEGRGGDIFINTPFLITENNPLASDSLDPMDLDNNQRVDINASGGTPGTISIPESILTEEALDILSDSFEEAAVIAAASCVSPAANPNRFVISGRGGVPVQTGSGLALSYETGVVRSLSTTQSQSHTRANVSEVARSPLQIRTCLQL